MDWLGGSKKAPPLEKVAVVGSGISGLCSAWHLQRSGRCEVTLLEAEERFGGNAWTVEVDGVDVDVGFLVYNNVTYPNLISLFEELGVETVESDMSFGFSLSGRLEWASHDLNGLLASRSNAFKPSFYEMLSDMIRFNGEMVTFLKKYEDHNDAGPTLGEFLEERKYSKAFIDYYLIPMISAVWSASHRNSLEVPARFIFRFFENHRLAQIFDRPAWRTVKGCSHKYVTKVCNDIVARGGMVRRGAKVTRVERKSDGVKLWLEGSDRNERFDRIVFATHAPATMGILGNDMTSAEARVLEKFPFADAECVLHRDPSWMPAKRAAWSAWNFVRKSDSLDQEKPVCVTYHINRLQSKNLEEIDFPDLFETLNPTEPIPDDLVVRKLRMAHPQFSRASLEGQVGLQAMQGENRTYYCGSWTSFGFHEDGARSGFAVAEKISGVPVPWAAKLAALEKVERRQLLRPESGSAWSTVSATLSRPIVEKFLDSSVRLGSLTIVDHVGTSRVFGERPEDAIAAGRPATEMYVVSPQFYTRVASSADIGFAEAYMVGAVEFESHEKLLDLFYILILNRDGGDLSNSKLSSSYVGTMLNDLVHKLLRRNTVTQSKKNIAAHYDLSNDLFATFLGKTWTYSCGLWLDPGYTLDDAQTAKIKRVATLARLDAGCHVLEIGFGWGEFAIYAAKTFGCRVTGLTLSEQQLELAEKRVKEAGVGDLVDLQLRDYREAAGSFDRIVSIEMLEAVGHEFLGDFFSTCDRCLKPEGLVVVQVITCPEERYEAYRMSSDFVSRYIFPGGCCPSVHALIDAMCRKSTFYVDKLDNFGPHYARTLASWRERFNANLDRVSELGFDELFHRMWNYYFIYCEAGFASRTLGLHQIVFSRPSNVKTLGGVGSPAANLHAHVS